jgi:hypothetical protein
MRITQDLLNKFATETVKQHQRSEPDLHAAYLIGSLIKEDPLLGGTTDIDLVLVHKYKTPMAREVHPLTPEVSVDIFHKNQSDYEQHRQLRKDPELGYPLNHPNILLFDTDHWLEFIQSSVRAEFHRPDNVLARVNLFFDAARANWFTFMSDPPENHLAWLDRFLEVLSLAANAVCGLIGPPLTTRRFLITLKDQVETLGVPNIFVGFTSLLGFSDSPDKNLLEWVGGLNEDYSHLHQSSTPPVHLSACRQPYYVRAVKALMESKDPMPAYWPLLRIWLDIKLASETSTTPTLGQAAWKDLLKSLNLVEETEEEKIEGLDAYLDTIEITIETWANTYAS